MLGIKIKYIIFLMVSMMFQSCYYVKFHEPYEVKDIQVGFEWEQEKNIPKSMRVIVYPADEITFERMQQGYAIFDMYSEGRKIQLPIGLYNAVSFNTDTEDIIVSGYGVPESLTASVTAFPSLSSKNFNSLMDSLFVGLPVKNSAGCMYSGSVYSFRVNPSDNDSLILSNRQITKQVKVSISSIEGMETLQQVMLSMAPLSGSTKVIEPSSSSQDCVQLCEANSHNQEKRVTASFNIFELNEELKNIPNHKIVLMFWLNEGNVYIPIDIGNLQKYYLPEEDVYFVEINSLDIDLTDYVTKQEGFDIDIEEWENINIDINI